jgi:mono/diheme cytochrome c family protein
MRRLLLALALMAAPLTAARAVDARALFLVNCASCHGEDGKADTELGAKYMAQDFTAPKFVKEFTVAKARRVIERGVKDTKMKSWKAELKPEEIEALAAYVMTFGKP